MTNPVSYTPMSTRTTPSCLAGCVMSRNAGEPLDM
jgi:hypothetical protein